MRSLDINMMIMLFIPKEADENSSDTLVIVFYSEEHRFAILTFTQLPERPLICERNVCRQEQNLIFFPCVIKASYFIL